jgi:hypothetical protein
MKVCLTASLWVKGSEKLYHKKTLWLIRHEYKYGRKVSNHAQLPVHYRTIYRVMQWGMLQRTILQRTNATKKNFINKIRLQQVQYRTIYIVMQWGMLQRTILQRTNATKKVFINKIRMLFRRQTLQSTRRNTIGRRSTRVRLTYRGFQLW